MTPEKRRRMLQGHLRAKKAHERCLARLREIWKEEAEIGYEMMALELTMELTSDVVCPRCDGSLLAFDAAPKDTAADRGLKPCPVCKDGTAPVLT